jgi:translation initiation factor IF-2
MEYGRVRALMNENGEQVKSAGPSIPVEILGLSGVPVAGDDMITVESERKAREVAMFRQSKHKEMKIARQQKAKLDNMFNKMEEGEVQNVNIILKADVQGSIEAIVDALVKLSNDEVKVSVISSGVGGITETDANLALASDALIFGFNVRADAKAKRLIDNEGIFLKYYSVIYEIVDEVKRAIEGKLEPDFKEEIIGVADVRDVFKAPKIGLIAGCMVTEGIVKRNNPIRVLRDNVVIYQGALESLRRFKDDVQEVRQGMECGIGVKDYNDVKVGDQIEVYERVAVKRTLS